MGWVIGSIIGGLVVLAVIAGVILYIYANRQVRAWEERIERDGELLLCWIASADESLYEVYDVPGFAKARVVFSTDPAPDLEQRLKEAANRLKKGDSVDENVDTERFEKFYEKCKDQRWLHPPLRLPKWLVGDFKAYTAVVQVYWRRLPKTRLTLPYLYCRVLVGEDGGVVMAEYPVKK
jgi:hypothetical protein